MAEQRRVMISSTARDLPEHRKQVLEACQRQGMFALRMEDLPANSDEAAAASVKMVEEADIYIGVFANRYGYIPKTNNPDQISVTEMEYNRAVDRKIERLIFVMDKSHPITVDDVDIENAAKLKAFKERVQTENIVRFFKSPDDLRAEAINSLSKLRQPDLTTFHYVSDIPVPPEEFIAHPYTLLQTHRLIGRQEELKLLTDWITGKELELDEGWHAHPARESRARDARATQKAPADSVRIMNVVAIGGMGKSALTWKWFNDVAPQEMKNLAGRMWWSFYESDATFENFVIRALAYVSKRSIEEVTQVPAPERETQLLAALYREPFLLVLDGLERILIAYARMDAARLDDSEVGKEKNFCKTADPRVGRFLLKLVQVKQSRILVSSRLYPAELETAGGDPIPGSFRINIEGLTDEDAMELWRAFGVSGSRDDVLPVFNTFAKHPLLIQALAGEVKRYRRAPGDLEKWRKANPKFDPSQFADLRHAMAHVLEFALGGLSDSVRRVLHTISAFRMPATYDTLTALLVGKGIRYERTTNKLLSGQDRLFPAENDLDETLTELENRGLVGWDKRANRYDLHPIVRSVVWNHLNDAVQRDIYSTLQVHFQTAPRIDDWHEVDSLEDLTPAIELYSALIGLRLYDDAALLFQERLDNPTLYRLSANRERVELLETLFPDGIDQLPRLQRGEVQAVTLNSLALGYHFIGQPGRAAILFERAGQLAHQYGMHYNAAVVKAHLANALRLSGSLYVAEMNSRQALIRARQNVFYSIEVLALGLLAWMLAARCLAPDAVAAFERAQRLFFKAGRPDLENLIVVHNSQRALWEGDVPTLVAEAERAFQLTQTLKYQRDIIRSTRAVAMASLCLNDLARADHQLHQALFGARTVNFVEEELLALVALAELRRRQDEPNAARELLDDVWELAERGPYPLFHADAFNVLAQIERDEGNKQAAIEAATKAYRLAWCDGPPFAYHWGLEKAKQHLKALGAPEPEMLPFDESKFEPMPEVEINPHDEFYVDEETGQ